MPVNAPIKSDNTTSLLIKAKIMAMRGGKRVKTPKIWAFKLAGFISFARAKRGIKKSKKLSFFINFPCDKGEIIAKNNKFILQDFKIALIGGLNICFLCIKKRKFKL